jgi:hypothetical protein
MNCPICTKPIPPRHEITCPDCWFKIPGNDRHALARMHRDKNFSGRDAKLASLKRKLEAKAAKAVTP